MRHRLLMALLVGWLGAAWAQPQTGSVTLGWAPVTTTSTGVPLAALGGYRLYQGTASHVYGPPTAVDAQATSTRVDGLTPGTTYYFALTALDPQGRESAWSNEIVAAVCVPVDPVTPPPVEGLHVNIRQFGAKGDGEHDDSHDIRTALLAVIEAGSGTITIPPGDWNIPGVTPPQTLPVTGVTAKSAQAGNPATQTIDTNLGTRWSAEGKGQWIQYDLGQVQTVRGVEIAWFQGNRRQSSFVLRASQDGQTWQDLYTGQSSGTRTGFERVLTGPVLARYVQIVGNGNNQNAWNSISEVRLYGTAP